MENEEESRYGEFSIEELISLLEERNLDSSGTKEEMITKLQEDDEETQGFADELRDALENSESLRQQLSAAVEKSNKERIKDIVTNVLGYLSWESLKTVLRAVGLWF